MDLLQTVRKEGSRGGVNFSWDDVKSSQHRENYLGHSLMAPVGRWQKGKDLNWYAKAEDAELTPEQRAEREQERKKEEMRKIKEAEEDAMARALGLPVPDRTNANNEPLGEGKISQRDVNKALKEVLDDGEADAERSAGLGSKPRNNGREHDKRSRTRDSRRRDRSGSRDRRRGSDDHGRGDRRRRDSRSRSRDRDREHRHRHKRRHRSRSPSRTRRSTRRSRSRDRHDDRRLRDDRDGRRDHEDRLRSRERERRHRRSRSR